MIRRGKKKKINLLIGSIVFAAAAISGSLFFIGMQIGKTMVDIPEPVSIDQSFINQGIENYIEAQNQKQVAVQEAEKKAAQIKAQNIPFPRESDHVRGKSDTVLTLIEYSDFECPYCTSFHSTAKEFLEKYGDQVNWVYRHFPLGFHDPAATDIANASECVAELGGNSKFWSFVDAIYDDSIDGDFMSVAFNMGIDKSELESCTSSYKYVSKIKSDISEGAASGVTGTPGNFLVNNITGEVEFIEGAYPLTALEGYMNELLDR